MDRVLFVVGTICVVLGLLASVAQLGNLVEYRRMRALERRGVEGEAVSVAHGWRDGRICVYYRVLLPAGDRVPTFYELTNEMPDPLGTVFPVVYDRKNPRRAMIGTTEDIDSTAEGQIVKYVGGGGLLTFAVGLLLVLVFAA